jgi:hypothetical protein
MDHAVEQPQAFGTHSVGCSLVCQGRYIPRFSYSFEGQYRRRLFKINLQLRTQNNVPVLGNNPWGQKYGCKA